jgi:hypothetical protein
MPQDAAHFRNGFQLLHDRVETTNSATLQGQRDLLLAADDLTRLFRQLERSALRAQTKRNLRQLGIAVYVELTQKQLESRVHLHRIIARALRLKLLLACTTRGASPLCCDAPHSRSCASVKAAAPRSWVGTGVHPIVLYVIAATDGCCIELTSG